MIELDTSQAPKGILTAQKLIEAVAKLSDLAERHYLELKSTLDLSAKADREKIAKFILGAANRMPEMAATAFEGYGVMIIGVAKDAITGIRPVEPLEISKTVEKFIGAAGPRWDLLWVPIEESENQVLVVIVDPPGPGQGPFPCRASGGSLTNGRVYIRADGETREANAEELDLLVKRGMVIHQIDVDFGVELFGEIASVTSDEETTINEYVETIRDRLLAALPEEESRTHPGSSSIDEIISGLSGYTGGLHEASHAFKYLMEPEERTKQEYLDSIDRWEETLRTSWNTALAKVAASQLESTVIRVTNRTNTFFHDVEVKLHLEGDIFAVDFFGPKWLEEVSDLQLPHPPRKWGPTQRSIGLPYFPHLDQVNTPSSIHSYTPSITFKNKGSVLFNLDVGELRPKGTYVSEDEEVVLIVRDRTLTSIHGSWELTARDHNDVYTGEIDIAVTGNRNLTEVTRRILLLERDGGDGEVDK